MAKADKKTIEESFTALDVYTDEARAGAPDTWLSEHTGVHPKTVERWRVARGIRRAATEAAQEQLWALQGLAASYDAKMHTTSSAFAGNWQQPQYVIREPLNYSLFARLVHVAALELELSDTVLAEGFGVREQDIVTAKQAMRAHLRRKGKQCAGCENVADPKLGPYCTAACRSRSA